MDEVLNIFDLSSNFIKKQDRVEFYREIKQEFLEHSSITKKVHVVNIILMNSKGRIYLQKRSKLKSQNSGLYDKTVGGHVVSNQSSEVTAIKECAEELGFPATIVKDNEFNEILSSIDLSIIGILKKIKTEEYFESKRINNDGSFFIQPTINSIFIGYYDGAIKFVDGECSGIEVMSLEELLEDLKLNSNKYTSDLKYLIEKYQQYFKVIED